MTTGLYNNLEPKIPEVKIERKRTPITTIKAWCIVRALDDYNACNARDAVCIIEKYGVDKFDFDYPYGSFEEFKKHTLAGEFDVEIKLATKEDHKKLLQDVKEGKVRVTY